MIGQFRYAGLGSALRASELVDTLIGCNARKPSFERTSPLIACELGVGFQEGLLSCVFDPSALPKEFAGNSKYSRAVSAKDLLKRPLVSFARQAYQFQVRSLFDLACQSRSSSDFKNGRPLNAGPAFHAHLGSLGALFVSSSFGPL